MQGTGETPLINHTIADQYGVIYSAELFDPNGMFAYGFPSAYSTKNYEQYKLYCIAIYHRHEKSCVNTIFTEYFQGDFDDFTLSIFDTTHPHILKYLIDYFRHHGVFVPLD